MHKRADSYREWARLILPHCFSWKFGLAKPSWNGQISDLDWSYPIANSCCLLMSLRLMENSIIWQQCWNSVWCCPFWYSKLGSNFGSFHTRKSEIGPYSCPKHLLPCLWDCCQDHMSSLSELYPLLQCFLKPRKLDKAQNWWLTLMLELFLVGVLTSKKLRPDGKFGRRRHGILVTLWPLTANVH